MKKGSLNESKLADSAGSSDEASDSESSSCGSPYDDVEDESSRIQCVQDIVDLERQFHELREILYRERIQYVEKDLEEVMIETSAEYQSRLRQLEAVIDARLEVAELLRDFQLNNLNTVFDSEDLASEQNYENEKQRLFDSIKAKIEGQIKLYETSIDISEDTLQYAMDISECNKGRLTENSKPSLNSEFGLTAKKRPVLVSGPYIVYQLKENEVMEDWMLIKKTLRQKPHK